jgi:hypothetical protein
MGSPLIGVYYKDPRGSFFYSEFSNPQHLIATPLEFIRHSLDPSLSSQSFGSPHDCGHMTRWLIPQRQ